MSWIPQAREDTGYVLGGGADIILPSDANISADGAIRSVDVTVTAAEMLALNATPKLLLAAPGAGKAIVPAGPVAAVMFLDYNSAAYGGIAAGEDLSVTYTGAGGTELVQVEATGFLDQTSDQVRYAAEATLVTPEENQAVYLHMLVGEVITGDSPLYVRLYYTIVPTTLS